MAVKAVLFDLDDTLLWDDRSVKESFEAVCAMAAREVPSIRPDQLEEAVRREARALYQTYETFLFTQMIGINPFEALWARFTGGSRPEFRRLQELAPGYRTEAWTRGLNAVGVDNPDLGYRLGEAFVSERRSRPLVYDETFEALNRLKGEYKLLLLTNGAPDLQREKLDGVPELAGYFDHVVISGDFGEGKPAPSIFRHAMELLGIEASEGIMVGDKLTTDILGSNRVGMRNLWLNRHGVTRDDSIVPAFEAPNLLPLFDILETL
ncbi:HAD family hydrolase [Cohnella caldifontis]|uniref:HAD family hydrolase n=1 Tax=Cohnella caldifontis TaxID=3027471 RepID=UPI0023EC429D|nr:HAD family hydrolase [Cohnella sp. YIM B05605]